MTTNFSLHQINCENTFPFSPDEYSRFKFGDDHIAFQFGTSLAIGFIETHTEDLMKNKSIVVVSSPYQFIPTATNALKNYFIRTLNKWLYENELNVVKEAKVSRIKTYVDDYGLLDKEQRMKLIGDDSFYIDKEFVKHHTLIFLDDIKITGSHEFLIKKMIKEYELTNEIYLLYFAELINQSINPNIENHLNYYAVKCLEDLLPIINSTSFQMNTRIVKYILNNSDLVFMDFINKTSPEFKKLLFHMSIGNNYQKITEYKNNIKLLSNSIS